VDDSYVHRTDDPRIAARAMAGIREDALVIGFARRFAPYKRAMLLFQDEERLARLVNDADRPVHFIFAGKAHPRDRAGQEILQRVFELTRRPPFLGRVFFLEDYDLSSARLLNQGVDVWLNNPTRPLEASGTSGMKVAANGGLNLSILDGWWIEGYDGRNGWAIGDEKRIYDDQPRQDQLDNQSLLHLLETEVVPLFFEREPDGLPRRWMERVTHALATLPAVFSTDRMVEEYTERAYVPLAAEHIRMEMGGFQVARSRAARLRRLRRGFPEVRIVAARVGDLNDLTGGDRVRVEMDVQMADLVPEDLTVELIVGHTTHGTDLVGASHVELEPTGEDLEGVQTFSGIFEVHTSGSYAYGLRVSAKIEGEGLRGSSSMMRWA
jgi:starch phosphorylase